MHLQSLFLLHGACLTAAFTGSPYLPAYLSKRESVSINGSDYPAHTLQIPVDHYNASDSRTFSNRYWINSQHYKTGGPVFYFDAGEQDGAPLVPYFLHEAAGPSSIMALARRFNGLAVLFEHRFYGTNASAGSYPYPMNSSGMPDAGYEAYQYLTTEQALEDPVFFAHNFQPPGLEAYWSLLHPSYTPWIWLGGSYPGIRGAQMRVRNPETFYATWASSAPTEARVNMWTYYAQAERSMTRNCSADYTAVTNYVDSILGNGSKTEQNELKVQLWTAVQSSTGGQQPANINTTEAHSFTNVDVANYLQLPFSFYQYYGFDASVKPFCDIMETFNRTEVSTTDNGGTAPAIASESGVAVAHNVTEAWKAFLVGIAEIDYDSIPYEPTEGDQITGKSWQWQYCSEYGKSCPTLAFYFTALAAKKSSSTRQAHLTNPDPGYYQVGNATNPHTIESRFISLDYFQSNCDSAFPTGLPPSPNITAPNKYGGWHINPSNTMFTSGEFDPWRALSPASTEYDSPHRASIQRIPACNAPPTEDTVFGIVYRDMVHVSDMRALLNESDANHQNFSTVGFSSPISREPYYAGVGLFSMALEEWLPCFRDGEYGEMRFQLLDAS